VYERDPSIDTRRQGYRLHVDARAGLALQDCLPPDLLSLFLATTGAPGKRVSVLSSQLRVLHETSTASDRDPYAPQTLSTSVNRLTLREILCAGLAESVHFGHELVDFVESPDGVSLTFADGSVARADVLVGADGVNSVVRRRYLPQAQVEDTGSRIIYGRTTLDDGVLARLPAPMHDGFTAVIGGRVGMACGLVRFRRAPVEAAAALAPDVRLSPTADYAMWAISAQQQEFGISDVRLVALDAAGLHTTASHMIGSWHPDLRELVARADVDETFLVRVRSAVPVPAWQPTRVTLLGDAIHAMSPARGSGANTALRDASVLCRALVSASDDPAAVVEAIRGYEEQLRDYGFAEVAASREAERTTVSRAGGFWLWLANRLPARRR